jgi:hypothetical protein
MCVWYLWCFDDCYLYISSCNVYMYCVSSFMLICLYLMMTARCEVQDFIWLVTLPVVDIMEHEWVSLLKNHIDELRVKLSKACYAVRTLRPFVSHESLRMIYYSYFHTVMSNGIIFWGNSVHSINIFKLQKKDYKNYYKLKKQGLS